MADRKLIVTIAGDDRQFLAALNRSSAAAKRFSSNVEKTLGRRPVSTAGSFGPLLDDVRQMQERADDLKQRTSQLGEGLDATGRAAGRFDRSLIPLVARGTAFGFALTSAYHASQRLRDSLTTTGEQAFTTSGRLKNLAAALLQGDLLGGIEALRRAPQTLEELGISAVEAGNRLEALQLVASGAAERIRESGKAAEDGTDRFEKYNDIINEAGTSNQRLARELVATVTGIRAAEAAQAALADSTARLGAVFRTTTGEAVTFKGAVDDLGGLRGPGLVDSINAALEAAGGPTSGRIARPIGPTAKNAAAQTIAAANEDLNELLRLQVVERDRLAKALANSTGNVKQREALNAQLASAIAAVTGTRRQLEEQNRAAAKAAEAARKDQADNFIAGLQLGIDRALLTKGLRDDLNALLAMKAGLQRLIKNGQDVAANQARLVTVVGQIGDRRDEIADAARAAEQSRQFRALGLSPSGEEIIPGVENLAKRLDSALEAIGSGQQKVSSKIAERLRLARNQIRKEGKNLTDETRSVINQLIKEATGTFDKATGPLTKTTSLNAGKLLEGLGLGRDLEKELRARLSSFNSAGKALASGTQRPSGQFVGGAITSRTNVVESHVTVQLDNDVVGRAVTRTQQKSRRRNPTQKRGPNSGV